MKKHEIAVFIDNKEMLREARELLEKYGETLETIFIPKRFNFQIGDTPHVYFNELYNEWCFCYTMIDSDETPITLPQLEEILKNQ
jgi:hypothetical protein